MTEINLKTNSNYYFLDEFTTIENKLLSICIPTYKRTEELLIGLTLIINNVTENNLEKFCQIIVSINGDDRVTADRLCKKFRENHRILSVIVQKENVGATNNMLSLLGLVKGKYIMFVGDDDYLPQEYLAKVTKHLYEFPLIKAIIPNSIQVDSNSYPISKPNINHSRDFFIYSFKKIKYFQKSTNISGLVFSSRGSLDSYLNLNIVSRYPHMLLFGISVFKGATLFLGSQVINVTMREDHNLKYQDDIVNFLNGQMKINRSLNLSLIELGYLNILTIINSGLHRINKRGIMDYLIKLFSNGEFNFAYKLIALIMIVLDTLRLHLKKILN